MKRPGFSIGTLVGGLLTTMLVAVDYLGHRLAGLPFIPFDLFDWTARKLPGAVVTAGIDALVATISALGIGPTADIAKRAEQGVAIAVFLLGGAATGGLLFAILRRRSHPHAYAAGLTLGIIAGLAFLAVSLRVGSLSVPAAAAAFWVPSLFVLFGAGLALCFIRLSTTEVREPVPAAHAEQIDRRTFLVRLGGATAVITVTGAVVGSLFPRRDPRESALAKGAEPWSATHRLPNADARVQPVRGTRGELTPVASHYRIDINTRPPVVDGEAWRLRVSGLVERPLELSLATLQQYEPMHQLITLECISNRVGGDLISTTRWTGVSLQRLIPALGLRPDASHLRIRSADGFHEVVSLDVIDADPRVMLCYAWDGLPLPIEHGFPLRIYIPDRFGMKQPKWIESIEAIDTWDAGYWVERGWSREAPVQTTAVIDTVATDMMMPQMNRSQVIPVGGIAYAGARGISRVELRTDDGDWSPAELRDPMSDTTWVLWRHDWPFQAGEHRLTVRCFDGRGVPQLIEPAPPHPDGATGLHGLDVMV